MVIGDQSISMLSRILACSDQHLNSRSLSTASLPPPACAIRVDLPEPPSLLTVLVAAGAKQDVAQAMQTAYHQRACEFREQALAIISRACLKLAQIPSTCPNTSNDTIIAAFKQTYLRKLNAWISEGIALFQESGPSVLRCSEDKQSVPPKNCRTFNHQYVPLLEHFFEENPFPTHADKVFLSQKFDMTYRQIHVWFQNRRNRTKRTLHKKPVSEGASIAFKTLTRRLGQSAIPLIAKTCPPQNQCLPLPSTQQRNILDGVAPPHAFPTIYPPSCEYNPFPSIPTFVTPEWPRRPVLTPHQISQPVMDVGKLSEQFSKLNVRDDSRSRSRRKAGNVSHVDPAATSAITVRPPPAPHPARIHTTVDITSPIRIALQPIPATTSSLHVFRSPSPDSPMTTLIPAFTHQRKISPLPKRIPPWSCPTPDLNKVSEGSIVSLSRSSLLSSVQDRRLTCSVSSRSSSTVTTPEMSSSPLSHST